MSSRTSIDHILKYTGIFGGVQGLNMLISVVRNKLTTHLLGPAGIGLMGIYLDISGFVSSSSNFGIPMTSVQHLSELFESGDDAAIERFVRVVRTWCMWTGIVAAVVCVAFAPLLSQMFFGTADADVWRPALVAPMVVATIIMGGEISILKGTRRLKRVAIISLLSGVALLCLTVPLYWSLGTNGILLALNITSVATLALHLAFTLPLFPWHVSLFSRQVLRQGMPMIRVGIPYVLSAMAGSGAAMALSALLLRLGTMDDVGLYRSATAVMVSYAGIVFTALEADYFPRLSSVNHDLQRRNLCINQQIQVCVALVGPFMIALAMMMPVVLHVLYAPEFMVIEDMALAAVFYTFLRAITTPISYTALAHGDSMLYLAMEVIYDGAMLVAVAACYSFWGLLGAGIGLSVASLFDLVLIGGCYGMHYGFRPERRTLTIIAVQTVAVATAVAACFMLPPLPKYAVCTSILLAATGASLHFLGPDSTIVQRITSRMRHNKS